MSVKEKTNQPSFKKEQFLNSGQRTGLDKDILAVVLDEGKGYTLKEAEKLIHDFKKRKVN